MSQTYQPQQVPPHAPAVESTQERIENGENIEDIEAAYLERQRLLVNALDDTKNILGDIRKFNKDDWVVRYPHLTESSSKDSTPTSTAPSLRRALSFADDPTSTREVVMQPGLKRSMTLASVSENEEQSPAAQADSASESSLLPPSSNFNVFRLDLKIGPGGTSASPVFLVNQLEKASIAKLVDERISASMSHIDKLKARAEDTSSKVLVTGDLNAGKSTLVNALLRREVLPVDQQPLTAMFCEVHDAADNEGKEEIHLIEEGVVYNRQDESTFTRMAIADLEGIVGEPEYAQRILKMYVNDTRAPSESLLHNGIADIALIDAPGLNRDSLHTTSVFARQEDIDVVVFVVSAENHFTLSAKEFLWEASKEKAYIFIVVNRYDQIRDKARCKRLILEQIKTLSPMTWEDAENLVHFVDSNSALHSTATNGSFSKLEEDLRSFVLLKRSVSKLNPVSTYLDNVLSDVVLLSSSNTILAESERDEARDALERARPVLEKMKANRESLEDGLENVEDEGASKAHARTRDRLNAALERVGSGNLADDSASPLPEYPGLFGVLDYARDVKKALLASIDTSVKLAEDEARLVTAAGVNKITDMADTFLPEGVERSRRIFMPSAMFSPRAAKKAKRNSGMLVAGGMHGLGIGLSQRPEMQEISFFDILDIQHTVSTHFSNGDESSSKDGNTGALSLASLGIAALTLGGGKAVGLRGAFEGLVRVTDLFGNETARKWAVPVVGAFAAGLTIYFVLELPNTIPKNVGRRIKASLIRGESPDGVEVEEELKFVNLHSNRVSRETRKVLRLASWDLRQRFQGAMEERQREVKQNEETERVAVRAIQFFENIVSRSSIITEEIRQ